MQDTFDNDGYEVCQKCNGSKMDKKSFYLSAKYIDEKLVRKYGLYLYCDRCKGNGKIDWISNVTGVSHIDAPEDYNDRNMNNISDAIALIKLELLQDEYDSYKEFFHALKSLLILQEIDKDKSLNLLNIFENGIHGIFRCDVKQLIKNDYIPKISKYASEYIEDCISFAVCCRCLDFLYSDILEGECISVNKRQMNAAKDAYKTMGIDIDDDIPEDLKVKVNDVIDWCLERIEDSCQDEDFVKHYRDIQKAFDMERKNYLTKTEIKSNGLLTT